MQCAVQGWRGPPDETQVHDGGGRLLPDVYLSCGKGVKLEDTECGA